MDKERYEWLMSAESASVTPEEYAAGWHFCPEMDGCLMGPGTWGEGDKCFCGHGPTAANEAVLGGG